MISPGEVVRIALSSGEYDFDSPSMPKRYLCLVIDRLVREGLFTRQEADAAKAQIKIAIRTEISLRLYLFRYGYPVTRDEAAKFWREFINDYS